MPYIHLRVQFLPALSFLHTPIYNMQVRFYVLKCSSYGVRCGSCLTAHGNSRQGFRTGNEEHHGELKLHKERNEFRKKEFNYPKLELVQDTTANTFAHEKVLGDL